MLPKKKPTGMTGGKPRIVAPSVSQLKKMIQARLREKAIERDRTCVVAQHAPLLPQNWLVCGSYRKDGELIVQAEHLVGRANSASYADMDNIILLCQRHHFYFKTQHPMLYWEIVRLHIGPDRWAKVQAWESDHTPHHMVAADWRSALANLNVDNTIVRGIPMIQSTHES
jgi:hypothetical protein